MSISPVGNSDAYARYRQQLLDLSASPSQAATQPAQATALSYVTPPDSADQSSTNPYTTKFKADLTALGSPKDGKSHAHGAHGHQHQTDAANATTTDITDPTTDTATTTDPTDPAAATDPFSQSLDEFANLLKTAAGIAAVIA